MSFTSFSFLIFFPIAAALNYVIPSRYRRYYLLLLSYYFYISWQPAYAVLLFAITCLTYFLTCKIDMTEEQKTRKRLAWLAGGIPLSSLIVFKYAGFINENINALLSATGLTLRMPEMKILMPIGISFYTFMAIGYVMDVYKKKTTAERNFSVVALFLSFFPQVTSGPIGRAPQLIPQLIQPRSLNSEFVNSGLRMMLWGYFMKLCVADRLGIYIDAVYGNIEMHNGVSLLLASILYTFQIYGDFAGYSLIAIGTAKVMGIELMQNFKRPYLSRNIGEFWGRWHISLSFWFRDYVYIPLGGNRVSYWRHKLNLFITFVVSGLWHGAAWNFITWGVVHGVYQVGYAIAFKKNQKTTPPHCKLLKHRYLCNIKDYCSIILCFALVSFAWIFFRLDMFSALEVIKKMFTDFGKPFVDITVFSMGFLSLAILVAKDLIEEFAPNFSARLEQNRWVTNVFVPVMAIYVLLFGVLDEGQFIYFQF